MSSGETQCSTFRDEDDIVGFAFRRFERNMFSLDETIRHDDHGDVKRLEYYRTYVTRIISQVRKIIKNLSVELSHRAQSSAIVFERIRLDGR